MKLIILRGIPASGKTTIAEGIISHNIYKSDSVKVFHYSSDEYWERPDGHYDFNPARLYHAHKWNQDRCKQCLKQNVNSNWAFNILIIDNTNTVWKEVEPYIKIAKEAGVLLTDIVVQEPITPWAKDAQECFERSKATHNVPLETIQKMLDRWESSESIWNKISDEYGPNTLTVHSMDGKIWATQDKEITEIIDVEDTQGNSPSQIPTFPVGRYKKPRPLFSCFRFFRRRR